LIVLIFDAHPILGTCKFVQNLQGATRF
jgi:hypothetical protein